VNLGTPPIRLINAQIRYYYKIEPTTLDDETWAMLWRDLKWLRKNEKDKDDTWRV